MSSIKSLLLRFLPPSFLTSIQGLVKDQLDGYAVKSYSQEGEDMILQRFLGGLDSGFYVDIGAHHPKRFSNTYLFYRKGWSGINVDATPGSMKNFEKFRPRDICIEVAIAKERKEVTFFMFNDPALNTFDETLALKRLQEGNYHIVSKQKLYTITLDKILRDNLPRGKKIDFLSIDVEGLDLEVLESNNWKLFKPHFILVECLCSSILEINDNRTYQYLTERGYICIAKTYNTIFFQCHDFKEAM
jgi:FkbM family methyltransferase